MLVGVVSDTHGLVRPEVLRAFADVGHIVHAGDIGRAPGSGESVLDELRAVAPITAVAGNNDGFRCGNAAETARVTLAGVRFFVTHILDRPRRLLPEVSAELSREPADVVVFGHGHLPHDELIGDVRFVNPASAGPRRFSLPVSVALIDLQRGRVKSVRFVPLDERSQTALPRHMNQLSRSRGDGPHR
jgi:putative phosphoesterase